jgi:branched-chain amino acid transport system permease protein
MTIGGFQVPFLRPGFRMVVFSVIIMFVVLFYRQGIMGTREFSIEGIYRFFCKKFGKKKEAAPHE